MAGVTNLQGTLQVGTVVGGNPELWNGGNTFFVDSGSGNANNNGRDPDHALLTFEAAIALCTANNGDTIVAMPGHNEGLGSGEAVDFDIAGISVIGLGNGTLRPRIDLDHASAKVTVGANNITIKGIDLLPSVTSVVVGLQIESGVTNTRILDVGILEGEDGSNADECITGIELVSGNHDTEIRGCELRTQAGAAECVSAIKLTAAASRVQIEDNLIVGNYSTAAIIDGAACANIFIKNNHLKVKDGEPGIELTATTTGIIEGNWIETTGLADPDVSIVAADCSWFRNLCVVTDGGRAELVGAAEAGSVEGKVDSVGTLVPVEAGSVGTLVDSVGTQATSLGTQAGSVGTLVDSVGTQATSLGTQITTVDAVVDAQPRCIEKSDGAVLNGADDIFTITGGPVLAQIYGIVTTVIGGASNMKLQITTTEPAATAELNAGAVAIDTNAAGTSYHNVGVTSVFTPVTAGAVLLDPVTVEPTWMLLPIGTVHATGDAAQSGNIKWYMRYVPLSPNSVVAAAA